MTAEDPTAAARAYTPSPEHFADRVVLVTGATAGIGRAVATDLVKAGATVILHGRSANKLEGLYQSLRGLGPEPAVAQLDLLRAQGEQYQQLIDEIENRYGRLDALLHNASMLGERSPIEHYDIGVWQHVLHVNLTSAFILTRCLLPLMQQSSDASLLFTTSGVGNRGKAFWGAYSVSKFGVESLTQILADELENSPIRVNCINPGATRTDMRAHAYPGEDPATLKPPEAITAPYLYLLGTAATGVAGRRIECQ